MRAPIYRPANASDRDSLLSFWWNSYDTSFPYITKRHLREDLPAFYDLMKEKGNDFHVADNGSIVGMCAYLNGHIQYLFVENRMQRQGIGTGLISYLFCAYNEDRYYLYVYQKNLEAIRLYKKLGFMIVSEHISKFEKEPGFRMERSNRFQPIDGCNVTR